MCQADIETTIVINSNSLSAEEIETCLRWKATRKVEKPESKVMFDCGLRENELLERHVENLCAELESRSEEIRSLPGDCEIVIWCVIYSKSHFVGFELDSVLIKRLAHLNTSVILSYHESDR